MKRILFSFLMGLCFLSMTVTETYAKTCKSAPDSFYYGRSSVNKGGYFVVWEREVPMIYFRNQGSMISLVAAEFNKSQDSWIYHGRVPNTLIEIVHWHWKQHKEAYKKCLGDYAWQRKKYYYAAYRSRLLNNPAYNWIVVSPRKSTPEDIMILKPKLELKRKKKAPLKKRKHKKWGNPPR